MSRGRLLIEAIDREHLRAQSRILAGAAEAPEAPESEPDDEEVEEAPICPQTWLE